MAREFEQEKYFDHTEHANTFMASLLPVEFFLSQVLLKGDLKRILFTSDDMVFRRRFMTNDAENGADIENIKPSALNFPFVNYWYDGFWEPDDRPYSVQPMQMIRGTWSPGLPSYLRAMAVQSKFTATAFYHRDDDARMAYELLMWEQHPKGPSQFTTTVKWKDTEIAIPVFITIEDVPQYNPEYKESDWLEKQRIFPIKFNITIRSYSIYIPIPENVDGQVRQGPYGVGLLSESEDGLYLTEEAILNFAAAKGWGDLSDNAFTDNEECLDKEDEFTDNEKEIGVADPREITTDLVRGYFEASNDITVNACVIDPSSVTQTSCLLKWAIRPGDFDIFDHMKILIPGHTPIWVKDPKQASVEIQDLFPNSDYKITVLFYSTAGGITDFQLTMQTLEDPSDPVKRPLAKRMGKLKGMEW